SLDRLQVALLLDPAQPARLVVGEAQVRSQAADLGVGLGVDEDLTPLGVALEHVGDLDLGLPPRRALDVGRDGEHLPDRSPDLGACGTADRHASSVSPPMTDWTVAETWGRMDA